MHKAVHSSLIAIVTAAVYFAIAWWGLSLATIRPGVSPVWPVTGFAIFAVFFFDRAALIGVFLGALSANFLNVPSLSPTLTIAFGNSVEAWVGAFVIRQFTKRFSSFEFLTQTFAIAIASALGAACSASLGNAGLVANGALPWPEALTSWNTWWIGDFLGGLIMAPACMFFYESRNQFDQVLTAKNFLRLVGCLAVGAAIMSFIFFYRPGEAFLFLLFPLLLLSAFALGPWGVWFAAPAISFVCILFTAQGRGPFASGTLNQNLIHIQLFLMSLALTSLTLAGILRTGSLRRPAIVMLICWSIFGSLFYNFDVSEKQSDASRFLLLTQEVHSKIIQRAHAYEHAIRAGVGFYAASRDVSFAEWRAFAQTQDLSNQYPGIAGIGVISPVATRDLKKFERSMRNSSFGNFSLHSVDGSTNFENAAPGATHYVVKFLEPLSVYWTIAGLVVSSEASRKTAADIARDTGLAAISDGIKLLHVDQKGFLIFLPIYKSGSAPATTAQRQKSLLGWVFAPIVADGFFAGLSGQYSDQTEMFVFEGQGVDRRLAYSSTGLEPPSEFERLSSVWIGQKEIKIGWRRGPGFLTAHDNVIAWIGLFGAIATIFLVSLVVALESINARSQKFAHQLTENLQRTLNKLKLITDNVPALIGYFDTEEKCQFANPAYAKWHGKDVESMIGVTMRDLLSEELYSSRKAMIQASLAGEAGVVEALLPERKEGEPRCYYVHYIPHVEERYVCGFFVMVIDVTELKRAEMIAVEEKNRAEVASQAKSQFVSNVSHEIRTPLNAIVGISGLLIGGLDKTTQRDLLEILRESADGLYKLINNILDFSKIEATKVDLERIEFDLRTVLQECMQSLNYWAQEKNLSLELSVDRSLSTSLIGDPARLRQIFINLLSNAIKFTTAGQIAVAATVMKESDQHVLLRFEVADSGIGIPIDAQKTIFDPFVQVDASTTRRFGGTGLGLSICRQLIELMGGKIGVVSQVGQGSTFWIELALVRGGAVKKEASDHALQIRPPDENCCGRRILLAEDNPTNQMVAVAQLQKYGFEVDVVNNGIQAVQALETKTYDLILMDCHMPDMDGYKTTTVIRSSEQSFCDIPIVAITASALAEERERCLSAGMNDFLVKPVQGRDLLRTLKKWSNHIVDPRAIVRLRSVENSRHPNVFKNVIQIFTESSQIFLDEISMAIDSKDSAGLFQAAHRLKSGAAQLGGRQMTQVCARLEEFGRKDDWSNEVVLLRQTLSEEHQLLIKELNQYL